MKNIIESQFSSADGIAIDGLITDLENAIKGKTGQLDDAERRRYGLVNEQNKLVVNKAREYRQSQPALSAPDIDWTEFENDFQARQKVESWLNRIYAIAHDLESTKIMHDYDNFQDALKDYAYAQYKNGTGEEGYDAKVNEFSQFFARLKNNPPEGGGSTPPEGGNTP